MDQIQAHWKAIRRVFNRALFSSFHYSLATLNPDGTPHITPIGSILLTQPGCGLYFEVFTRRAPQNLDRDARFSVLAVNSGPLLWLRAFVGGRFAAPPAVRLTGRAGERRLATPAEQQLWQRRVGPLRHLPGARLLWGNMRYVRELHFDALVPVTIGVLTKGHWEA